MITLTKTELVWLIKLTQREAKAKSDYIDGIENSPFVELVRLDIANLTALANKLDTAYLDDHKRIAIK